MGRKNNLESVKQALRRLLARHHGRRGEVDRRLGHTKGFLCRKLGSDKLRVEELLGTLSTLRVEPGEFFGEVFDILPRPEQLLRRQEKPGKPGLPLARIEKATLALEAEVARGDAEAEAEPSSATRSRRQLESFARTRLDHQRKVLREESWVRDAASLRRYLEQLDVLRFDRADDSASLAETVAVEIVAGVSCPQDRLELLCHAIGTFGSARRVSAELATAARAIGSGLRLAGRHGLAAARADLLQRGAYVLRDAGFFDHALDLLDDAFLLWAEQGRPAGLGKTMVDRAIVFSYTGKLKRADRAFKVALTYLVGDDPSQRRNRLSVASGIAFTKLQIGDAEGADRWLQRAIDLIDAEDSTTLGKMIWKYGILSYQTGDFIKAERGLTDARKILGVEENPIQGALVALDLAAALHAQGKTLELHELAEDVTGLLRFFDDNRLAQAALMHFIRAGLDGRITDELIEEAGKKLGRARSLLRAHPRPLATP